MRFVALQKGKTRESWEWRIMNGEWGGENSHSVLAFHPFSSSLDFDHLAAVRRRGANGIPQPRHTQTDFWRTRIGHRSVAHRHKRLPDAKRWRHRDRHWGLCTCV